MATTKKYNVGSNPPQVLWTLVRGDTASFSVYVTDDTKQPLDLSEWDILMKIKRPNDPKKSGIITDDATLILTLEPIADGPGHPGYFTVSITSEQSNTLNTGDIFDIELSTENDALVWTVAQGSTKVLEDVTD